ncbi:uncharacterized protein MYCFIDRAFT_175812 [Pseudocercospora fijiensis CIRAD86]|uniref:Uncharacterized protein n=1 Tax=Pseudocercospora fijiensis (strain CIRAD86) TaxID=383855 RepID=M3ACI7_PSEFD|nr:uncharacterized protein MYCFIDRAFT_175812 [Pseudocercospora fijiensis CIRAD86]EME82261.1 hypothetical protein MYCFIDRAFT_175812 [Pseudocercospora fijiensis CIRAD86]
MLAAGCGCSSVRGSRAFGAEHREVWEGRLGRWSSRCFREAYAIGNHGPARGPLPDADATQAVDASKAMYTIHSAHFYPVDTSGGASRSPPITLCMYPRTARLTAVGIPLARI